LTKVSNVINETPTDTGPFSQFIVTPLYKPLVIPSAAIYFTAHEQWKRLLSTDKYEYDIYQNE